MKVPDQLNHSLHLDLAIEINASLEQVWKVLTSPEYIKKYLYGTTAISEWKKGSSLVFKGEWEGVPYEEKGTILEFQKPELFKYSYFTAFYGIPDLPENYSIIMNKLTEANGIVKLHLTQTGFTSEEKLKHSHESWTQCLESIKSLAE
jgi:uncharacterized protein YndB with AHSA1/START domain